MPGTTKAVSSVFATSHIPNDDEGPSPAVPTRAGTETWVHALREAFLAERTRWFLWVPVLLGAGASVYFALPFEPVPTAGISALAGLCLLFALAWKRTARLSLCLPLLAMLVCAAGFAIAQQRTRLVAAPIIAASPWPRTVAGEVLDVEPGESGARVVLDHLVVEGLPPDATPVQVRLRLTRHSLPPRSGSVIRLRAVLMPPEGPAQPGAHDFRRDLFFERIGGVGYAMGRPIVIQPASERPDGARLERLRQGVAAHVDAALGDTPQAAIVVAYLTGERGLIGQETADDMRASGLAHLLALSGMKVGLVAVLTFAACRLLLALLPGAAARTGSRKLAAVAGIAAAASYVAIAAAPVPALRSVLMSGMGMFAIIVGRQAISLRLAAIAACIVLCWQPESVTGVSFQMSFGAVIALISFYEAMQGSISRAYSHAGRPRRIMLGFAKLVVTTLVATLVTSPLALFHFQQEANYSVFANAIAIPLNDIWIMPFGIVAMLLMPFGLDRWPLTAMGMGVHGMLLLAHAVARWPHAVTRVPSLPDAALVLLELGGLWVILWKGRWRRLGWMVAAAGCFAACFVRPPDVLVSEDGKRAAFRLRDGMLAVSKIGSRHDFTVDTWNRMNAGRGLTLIPETGVVDDGRISCQSDGCLYRHDPSTPPVVLLRDPAALSSYCSPGAIIISSSRVQAECAGGRIIDGSSLAATGALAMTAAGHSYEVTTVAGSTGLRPWSSSAAPEIRLRPSSGEAAPPADPESEPDPR